MAAPSKEEVLAMYGISEEEAAEMNQEDLGELVGAEQAPSIGAGALAGGGAGWLAHVLYANAGKSDSIKSARRRFKKRRSTKKPDSENELLEGADTVSDWEDLKNFSRRKRTKNLDFGDKWAATEEKPLSTRTRDLQSKLDRLVARYEKPAPWYHFGIGPDNVPGVDMLGQKMDEDYFKRRGKHQGGLLLRTNGPDHFGNYPHLIDDPYGTMYSPNVGKEEDDENIKESKSWKRWSSVR
jgi:hypothetical protein